MDRVAQPGKDRRRLRATGGRRGSFSRAGVLDRIELRRAGWPGHDAATRTLRA